MSAQWDAAIEAVRSMPSDTYLEEAEREAVAQYLEEHRPPSPGPLCAFAFDVPGSPVCGWPRILHGRPGAMHRFIPGGGESRG